MPVFRSRYRNTCKKCAQTIEVGALISWSRRQSSAGVYHAECAPPGHGQDPAPQSAPQSQSNTGSPEPQSNGLNAPEPPHSEPPHARGIDEDKVRDIARVVAQEEDASNLKTVLRAVDKRLKANLPTNVTVNVATPSGATVTANVDHAHHCLPALLYLLGKRKHAYLYGPPGSGKSTAAVQAAKALGVPYGYVSLNPQTPESRLLGFIDAGGNYRATEFYRVYTQGGIFCIDELDNGHPALLNTLNGMLEVDSDGIGRGAFPCGVVERHPEFVCVGTGNTSGRGADKLFPERRALDAAFLERFTFLSWDYDEAMERSVTLAINPSAVAWLAFVRKVRTYTRDHGVKLWASPRASFNGASMLKDSGWTHRDIADAVLFKGLDVDTVARILDACPLPEVDRDVEVSE